MGWIDKFEKAQAGITKKNLAAQKPKKIDKNLLLRQAFAESSFNPKAVSPAGYKGLTQIGDAIIEDYKKSTGVESVDPFNIQDAYNVQDYAMNELYNSSFINKPDQDDNVRLAKALVAYNWGRGNLYKFLNKKKKLGEDTSKSLDWIKDLPKKETRDYIDKIQFGKNETFNRELDSVSKLPKHSEIIDLYKSQSGGWIDKYQNGGGLNKYQDGGIIEDDRGQWAHPGEITKINSNDITMKGVNYPVLGISDEGDKKMMMPGQDYKFKGKSVTEYPMAQNGDILQKSKKSSNFTSQTNWLDKYTK